MYVYIISNMNFNSKIQEETSNECGVWSMIFILFPFVNHFLLCADDVVFRWYGHFFTKILRREEDWKGQFIRNEKMKRELYQTQLNGTYIELKCSYRFYLSTLNISINFTGFWKMSGFNWIEGATLSLFNFSISICFVNNSELCMEFNLSVDINIFFESLGTISSEKFAA